MSFRFYIVVLNAKPGLTIADIQAALGNDLQWYRVANNAWVVHTVYDSQFILGRVTALAHPGGSLFISRLDPREKQGWMDPAFWNWLSMRTALGV